MLPAAAPDHPAPGGRRHLPEMDDQHLARARRAARLARVPARAPALRRQSPPLLRRQPGRVRAAGGPGDRRAHGLLGAVLRANVGAASEPQRRHPRRLRGPPARRPPRADHVRGDPRLPAAPLPRGVDPPPAPDGRRDPPAPLRRGAPGHLAARVRLSPALRVDAPDRAGPRAGASPPSRHRGDARRTRSRVFRRGFSPRRGRPGGLPLPRVRCPARGSRGRDPQMPRLRPRTPYRPYRVASRGGAAQAVAFIRDPKSTLQVWSRDVGYPGDPAYLEFHKKHFPGGLRFWRVTDPSGDLGKKAVYDPSTAAQQAEVHAQHFAALVRKTLEEADGRRPALVCPPYDSELFGHWWFEGPLWLEQTARALAAIGVEPVTLAEALEAVPARETLAVPEGSWGEGRDRRVWLNRDTE